MDLRLTSASARNAAVWILNCLGAVLLLWFTDTYGQNLPPGTDYLRAEAVSGGRVLLRSGTESVGLAGKQSGPVQYQAFDGSIHDLNQYQGHYVNVLLPGSESTDAFLTADQLEELVDRLDNLYSLYREILQQEPEGEGLLNIAFVPQTCGTGCGLIGSKGIEILSDPSNYESIGRELDAGRLDSILIHEMVHNFDTFSRYLHYLPDHAHAWTDMFEFFAPYRYARETLNDRAPDDIYNSPIRSVWKEYVTSDFADWETCVKNQACEEYGLTANHLWAMLYYRIETLHGVEALLGSFDFIRDYASKFPPPQTEEEKEGLRILSLAVGAETNVACYMDSLRWPVPSDIRGELHARFGGDNPNCADLDHDGFSRVNGDCDDGDASRHIFSLEIAGNGVDDDCDELVDEASLVEWESGDASDNFARPVNTKIPFEARGTALDSEDEDPFHFDLTESGRARVTLCARDGFGGWAVALQPEGSFLDAPNWYTYQPAAGCSSNTFDYGDLSRGGLAVLPDGTQGEYQVTVSEASELPRDLSVYLQSVPLAGGGVSLQIDDRDGELERLGTDQLEIWISDVGAQLLRPYSKQVSVELTRAAVPDLATGKTYQARIRPRAGGKPLAALSPGHLFRFGGAGQLIPQVDHGFSGAWFDPDHEGEGFIVEVLEGGQAVIYWFTYHEDGRQRWLFGAGQVLGNRIVIDEMLDARGATFGNSFDPGDVVMSVRGSLTVTFLGCGEALANYSIDNNGGHQELGRLTNVQGHECGAGVTAPAPGVSGSWFDPAHQGEGFVVQQTGPGEALVVWFTYDETGQQSWLLSNGSISGSQLSFPSMLQPVGGEFGRSFRPEAVSHERWGELTLDLDCQGGIASYRSIRPGYPDGSQSLVPLTRLQGSGCLE